MFAQKQRGVDRRRRDRTPVALLRVLGLACCALLQGSFAPAPVEESLREVAGILEDVTAQPHMSGERNLVMPGCNDGCSEGNALEKGGSGTLAGGLSGTVREGGRKTRRSQPRPAWPTEALRRRLTIPLPEEVRFLFPGEADSLFIDPETLWLARCIYSESDRAHEQELVAWVVRNRVATHYRGKTSYREVVLDPFQFSVFNRESRRRPFYLTLMPHYAHPRWQRVLIIAAFVRRASWKKRPFPVTVRHFYSEVSMPNRSSPQWAAWQTPVQPWRSHSVDPRRFRFFALTE